MYAVVSTGGKQLKVEKGTEAVIERLDAEVGDTVTFDVLFAADGDTMLVGHEAGAAATVTAEVVEHFKSDKVVVFKFKKRKGYKRMKGHRQNQTRVVVTDIMLGAAPKKPAKAAKPASAEEQKPKKAPKVATAPKTPKAPKAAVAESAVEGKKPTESKLPEQAVTETAGQCEAIKGDGQRCQNKAKDGSKYCGVHAKKYEA